jgi:hypothetical protein
MTDHKHKHSEQEETVKKRDLIRHASALRVTAVKPSPELPPEIGGREGPEPTRYGDWEVHGKCTDF